MKTSEFTVGDRKVRSHLMTAEQQWHFARRVEPMLPAIDRTTSAEFSRHGLTMQDLLAAFASLEKVTDHDTGTMLAMTLGATEVWVPPSGEAPGDWWPVRPPMFELAEVLQIMAHVVAHNLGPLYTMERPKFTRTMTTGASFTPAHMPDEADWLYRPVLRGMMKLEGIWDGSIHIEQIARANDILDVAEENERRAMKAAEKQGA